MAMEVKTGRIRGRSGLDDFRKEYPHASVMLVGDKGIPWQKFLRTDTAGII